MQHGNGRVFGPLFLAIVLSGGGLSGPAQGQAVTRSSVLTLQDAIDRTLLANPGLRAAGYEIDIERARRDFSALAPPLTLQAEVENFLGTGSVNGVDGAETTLQLTRALELGGKRENRTGIGTARISRAETARSLAQIDLAADVTRQYIEMIVRQEEVLLARQAVELAGATLDVVRERVDVGRSSDAELATADIAVERAGLTLAGKEGQLAAAQLSLAIHWGDEAVDFQRGAGDLFALPAIASLDDYKSRVPDNPDLLRIVDERRIAEAERRLADSRQRSDLSVGLGVRHLGQIDDSALVVSVSMPLGSASRTRPNVREAAAKLGQLPALAEQHRLEVIAALYGLYQELSFALDHYTGLNDRVLPRGQDAARLYREGFEIGSNTLFEFSQAQGELLALRQEALAAAASYHLTLVDIEQLLGGTYQPGVLQ
jgi:cobalt-zinc-cadmium efflux system outer membrane protein